ncbi:la-related protein 6A [Asparagus officinalis]|uniref:la-related protein 6A n=1 Tax=Asparagus officinalis TaxID=4686 RepID=UPI00098E6E92|nr:la-related protein 6A [Asparagus officinalis]
MHSCAQLLDEGVDEEEGTATEESVEVPAVLTDDLRDKIVRQVEYYFSDENLPTDKFMLTHVKKDKQGFVPIVVIASFRKMKRLVRDLSLIEEALRTSSQLVVSKDGRKVRRLHPLPVSEIKDSKLCTVIVENLPDDYSTDNLEKIFAKLGKVLNITVHDPHTAEDSKLMKKTKKAFSSKLHALIEYETTEAAANAVAALNDEKDWRSGMRVELLHKRMGKYGLVQRGKKETLPEKGTDNQTSEKPPNGQKLKYADRQDENAEKEDDEHFAGGKGKCRSRYRSRGWGPQNATGQGHGQVPTSSNGVNKPPPGPRMPDGTRGFTMGRGKPAISEPNQLGA